MMSLVRSRDTKPEMLVRRLVHRLGYRYRLHRRDLPGVPDLVFSSRQRVIFVNGCFWHGHSCRWGRIPKSHVEYWEQKIGRNRQRVQQNLRKLRRMKWKCLVLWECELEKIDAITSRIIRFLDA